MKSPSQINSRVEKKPTTEEWHAVVLRIKAFCEQAELGLNDTNYGHLATLFYEIKKDMS